MLFRSTFGDLLDPGLSHTHILSSSVSWRFHVPNIPETVPSRPSTHPHHLCLGLHLPLPGDPCGLPAGLSASIIQSPHRNPVILAYKSKSDCFISYINLSLENVCSKSFSSSHFHLRTKEILVLPGDKNWSKVETVPASLKPRVWETQPART